VTFAFAFVLVVLGAHGVLAISFTERPFTPKATGALDRPCFDARHQLALRRLRSEASPSTSPGPAHVEAHGRRQAALRFWAPGLIGCCCAVCAGALKATAVIDLVAPPEKLRQAYDAPRDKGMDASFAQGMSSWMADYERAVAERKRDLFQRLFRTLPARGAVVVDLGIGTFPNAPYFAAADAPLGMDVVGIDPNDSMASVARKSADRAGLLTPDRGNSLRTVHAVAETLPIADGTADAVVSTLTLCSVQDPVRAIAEVRRVLRPGGRFLFWEHVLSETSTSFAAEQRKATKKADTLPIRRTDTCRFDRRTLEIIRAAGFSDVDSEYFELPGQGYLSPTVAGIALA